MEILCFILQEGKWFGATDTHDGRQGYSFRLGLKFCAVVSDNVVISCVIFLWIEVVDASLC